MKKLLNNKPLVIILASFPVGAALLILYLKVGPVIFGESWDSSDGGWMDLLQTFLFTLTWGLPIYAFIGVGIHNIVTSPNTVPKEKERMPWHRSEK